MNKIFIFGGTGSLGKELVSKYKNENIIVFSRDEAKHWKLKNTFPNITSIIGDVRDYNSVYKSLSIHKPNIIIIAHAMKQVDTCENNPEESIKTNINGVLNIINSINLLNYNPECVCFISTDKACSPINVYGLCKSISEKLITSQSHFLTKWICVRYGNVLTSTGSILPLLIDQSKNCTEFTLTNNNMTRFIMHLDEAVNLIDYAINFGNSGDIIVPKLKSMKIIDLLEIFSEKFNKPIKNIGTRIGEKIHESMISELESNNLIETDLYFIINKKYKSNIDAEYSSRYNLISKEELKKIIYKVI